MLKLSLEGLLPIKVSEPVRSSAGWDRGRLKGGALVHGGGGENGPAGFRWVKSSCRRDFTRKIKTVGDDPIIVGVLG